MFGKYNIKEQPVFGNERQIAIPKEYQDKLAGIKPINQAYGDFSCPICGWRNQFESPEYVFQCYCGTYYWVNALGFAFIQTEEQINNY